MRIISILPLLVSTFLLSACTFSIQGAASYLPDSTKPTATIQFLPGALNTRYTNLYFFDDAASCKNRYVLGLVSPEIQPTTIKFNKEKPFAFAYLLQNLSVARIQYCTETLEFTPTADAYQIVLNSGGQGCVAGVFEVDAKGERKRIETMKRAESVPFSEDGSWCSPRSTR